MNRRADISLLRSPRRLPRPRGALVAVFVMALILPAISTVVLRPAGVVPAGERLEWAGKSLSERIGRLREHVSRHFTLRPQMIDSHARLSLWLFGRPATSKVVPGRDGWLYFGEASAVRYTRRSDPFTPEELAGWSALLERRRRAVESHGSRFFVVISPDKPTIYPEFLPASLVPLEAPSRMDQLLDHLRRNTAVEVIDLRKALLEAKSAERVYHRTDTHWNDRGAFAAAREFIRALSRADPRLKPPERSDFVTGSRHHVGTDLANMTGLSDHFPEELLTLSPKRAGPELVAVNRYESIAGQPADDLPTMYLFHTSYGETLRPLLARHFRQSHFRFLHAFDGDAVAAPGAAWPDFVISEFAERNLALPPPVDNLPDGSGRP